MLDMIFSWNTVWWLMLFLYVPSCLGLVVIVLLQKGKGVGFAGAFGAGPGGGDAVFGPRSSKSLPQKITYGMAGVFMLLALFMSMLSGNLGSSVAPSLVEDTGITPVVTSGAGSIDELFGETTTSTPEAATQAVEDTSSAPAPAGETAPVTVVETPAEEAPATEAPAEEAAPEAAPAAGAPAEEAPAPAEAPAAEAPAADAPAESAPAAEETPAAQ